MNRVEEKLKYTDNCVVNSTLVKKKTPLVCVTQGLEKRREESDERKYCVSIRSSKLIEI